MAEFQLETPAPGSRILKHSSEIVLFGQPPDIVKGLLGQGNVRFDTLVLPDKREKNGSLLNHLEFPLYSFLFISKGLADNRKLNLVGDEPAISQALRLLRITLVGPTPAELDAWGTETSLKQEWLEVAEELALKNDAGEVMQIGDFFNLVPFKNNRANTSNLTIERISPDCFAVSQSDESITVDLNQDQQITPPYPVVADYVPGGLNKFSIEVLGGASGFSTSEPCTGLALCFNGDYLLIDSIPFLDEHLFARGISKNQVTSIFLTHLHDDHCSMFPLMQMPHRVEVITTREIFNMAMDKLACGLGWKAEAIAEHFQLIEVNPGESINYFGLNIEVHHTVHSVPTIGATFSTVHKGIHRDVCIIGDNQSMNSSRSMCRAGVVRPSTIKNLERLYQQRFNLLIADGGEGEIHGDPSDALNSQSDRVVFVHVEDVPDLLKATFSVVSAGKRYTLLEGDASIYTTQVNRFLTAWLGQTVPNRWLYNLLVEHQIVRYNAGDVIIVQDSESQGQVYMILTGYCDVVRVEDYQRHSIARLQAGDVIGEMAILTGTGIRNASVVARSPVTVCVFEEQTFSNFIHHSGFKDLLEQCWSLRPQIKSLPQFSSLLPNVIDKVAQIASQIRLPTNNTLEVDAEHYYVLAEGKVIAADDKGNTVLSAGSEFGWIPHADHRQTTLSAQNDCLLLQFSAAEFTTLLGRVPQLNYQIRKRQSQLAHDSVDWSLGKIATY